VSGLADSAFHRRDRIWPAVVVSLALHAAVMAAAAGRRGPTLDLTQKPIVARLVRLGEARPKELLPRKEAPPAPPTAPPAPVASAPPPASAPTVAPSAKAVASPSATARPAAERSGPARGNRLASVLSEMKQELQAGSPDGDPLGDSAEGEGDQYLALVVRQLRQNYRLPSTISEAERLRLTGTVVLFIEPDGRITRYELVKRSTNPAFDEALERAVRQTRLPPPPPEARDAYRKNGVQVEFRIRS